MPPKARPRPYTTLDRDYLAQDTIRDLGEQYGADGPLVFLAVILSAGKVTSSLEPGWVELRYSAVAREAFTTVEKARKIVNMAVEVGVMDSLEDIGRGRFRAHLTKHEQWESHPLSDAERSAAYRERKRHGYHE